jgi:hypothetical protein
MEKFDENNDDLMSSSSRRDSLTGIAKSSNHPRNFRHLSLSTTLSLSHSTAGASVCATAFSLAVNSGRIRVVVCCERTSFLFIIMSHSRQEYERRGQEVKEREGIDDDDERRKDDANVQMCVSEDT